MSNFKNVYNFFNAKDKKRIILVTALFVIGALLESLSVGLVLPIFSLLVGGKETLLSSELLSRFISDDLVVFIKQNSEQTIIFVSLTFITITYLLKNIYLSISYFFAYKFIYQFQIDITNNLFQKYLESNYSFFLNTNKSTLVRNIQEEIGTFIRRLMVPGVLMISEFLTLFFLAALLISANPIASLVAIILGAFFGILMIILAQKKIKKWGIQRQIFAEKKLKNLFESFNSIIEIKLRGAENVFLSIFKNNNILHIISDRNVDLLNLFPRFILEFFGVLLFSVIIITLYSFGYGAKSILPIMALFAAAAFRILPSINRLLVYYNSFLYGTKAFERINKEFLNKYSEFLIYENKKHKEISKEINFNSIKFNNVNFSYNSEQSNVFNNINLKINKGEFVGITGESGSGKSTLVLMMCGLLKPNQGEIKINETFDIQNDEINFNKIIGYVSQKTTLFDDTIQNNIALGMKEDEIDKNKIESVIKTTQLKEFVDKLPKGLDTIVGDDGLRISGGQRQRIAIARALYFNPQLLIFDEATSALDIETENKIIRIIENLKGKLTLVFISHKIRSLEICDIIYETKDNTLIKKKL